MEQISLKEIIQALNKWKWVIVIFTIACVLASIIAGYALKRPAFAASSTISVNPIDICSDLNPQSLVPNNAQSSQKVIIDSTNNIILGSILKQINYPKLNLEIIKDYMELPEYKATAFNEFKFTDKSANIQINGDDANNILTISATDTKPDSLAKIVKALKEYLPEYIEARLSEQFKATAAQINNGKVKEAGKLAVFKKQLDDFVAAVGGAGKLDSLTSDSFVNYQDRLNDYLISKQIFESYKLVGREFEIITSTPPEELININTLSEDTVARNVTGNMKKSAILAAFLGLCLSIFGAVVIEFMRKKASDRRN